MLVLGLGAMALLMADLFMTPAAKKMIPGLAAGTVVLAWLALLLVSHKDDPSTAFYECLRFGPLVFVGHNVILTVVLFLLLLSPSYLRDRRIPQAEYYALMLFAALAMMALAASNELLTLFVNLELLSITFYVMTGMERDNLRSTEAAFKYFLTGSYAAAFLLFGLTMIYGAIGSTYFEQIGDVLSGASEGGVLDHPLFLTAGFALMLVGFGFKLTLAPFHMYAPDVYAGAPTPVVGAIATGSKIAGLVVFFTFFRAIARWEDSPPAFRFILFSVCVLSIFIGNVGAVLQPNIKRLLAYSGIAHSGYALIPIVAAVSVPALMQEAEKALAFYLLAYGLMTVLAFGVAIALGPQGESHIDRYGGLARRSPFLAAVLALALLSLTGVPLTVGFVGKFYLFAVAVHAELYGLAIFGVLASVASAYYYLRVIVKMYMDDAPGREAESVSLDTVDAAALLGVSAAVLLFAIFPARILFEY